MTENLRLLRTFILLLSLARQAVDCLDVVGVKPASGPRNGGTLLTISGTFRINVTYIVGFSALYEPVNDVIWVDAIYVSSSRITVVSPACKGCGEEASRERILVIKEEEVQADKLFTFYYYDTPNITAISPTAVSPFGGQRVTLLGDYSKQTFSTTVLLRNPAAADMVLHAFRGSEGQIIFEMTLYTLPSYPANVSLFLALNGVDYEDTLQNITLTTDIVPLKVCFMFFNELANEPGWTYASNYGRLFAEAELGTAVQTVVADQVRGSAAAALQAQKFANDSCKVIIGTHITHRRSNTGLPADSDVKFILGGEKERSEPNVAVCFPKLYESRYLAGIVAGRVTKSNLIGYVIAKRIPQTIRQVNAFTLGARMVNPNVTVVLYFTDDWNSDALDVVIGELFLQMGVDVVSQHTNGLSLQTLFHQNGKYSTGVWSNYAAQLGDYVLVSTLNEWGPCFVEYTRQVLHGTWEPNQVNFKGVKAGYTDISPFSWRVPLETQVEVLTARQVFFQDDGFNLFCGPMEDHKGEIAIPAGKCLNDEEIESFEWMNFTVMGIEDRGFFSAPNCDQGYSPSYDENFYFTGCTMCPNGTYTSANSMGCLPCEVGTYGTQGICKPCDAGTFSNQTGSSVCKACSAGSFQQLTGQTDCDSCASGYFSASKGATFCDACDTDEYNPDVGATTCLSCPANTVAAFRAANFLDQCMCQPGYFSPMNQSGTACEACPYSQDSAGQVEEGSVEYTSECTRMQQCAQVTAGDSVYIMVKRSLIGDRLAAADACNIGDLTMHVTERSGSNLNALETQTECPEIDLMASDVGVQDRAYICSVKAESVGWYLMEVFIDGVQADFSPFTYEVTQIVCPEGQTLSADGTSCHEDSDDGLLLPIWATIAIAICVQVLLMSAFAYHYFFSQDRLAMVFKQHEVTPVVDETTDSIKVCGVGTFGVVFVADFRGMQVAVKTAIPNVENSNQVMQAVKQITSSFSMAMKKRSPLEQAAMKSPSTLSEGHDMQEMGKSQPPPVLPKIYSRTETITLRRISANDSQLSMGSTNDTSSSTGTLSRLMRTMQGTLVGCCSSDSDGLAALKQEMRLLVKLRHPHILGILGMYHHDNYGWCMVMEFMNFGALYDILHNNVVQLDVITKLRLVHQVAQGIQYLHESSPPIIHGDIKTRNVLVDSSLTAKVADFGVSFEKTMRQGGRGTPFWMAPELLEMGHVADMDTACDVYSLGVTIWEIFTMKDPYDDLLMSPAEVCKAVRNDHLRPSMPADVPLDVKDLIVDCWHKNPGIRPSISEVVRRVQRIISDVQDIGESTTNLLHQVLPPKVAEALRCGRKVEPELHDPVTIFFSDVVGYTELSSQLPPEKVMNMLDRMYTKFDFYCNQHHLFKVETIGDAYMCVGGLPEPQSLHTARIALFAMDVVEEVQKILVDEDRPEMGYIKIRVGFHTGSVMASVVGELNPRYCLFGDTVNTAARMETNSKTNMINMSHHACAALLQQMPDAKVSSRGEMNIKGKGILECFFLEQTQENHDYFRKQVADNEEIGYHQRRSSERSQGMPSPSQDASQPHDMNHVKLEIFAE